MAAVSEFPMHTKKCETDTTATATWPGDTCDP